VQAKHSRERACILDAAKRLFFRNGYAGTTVDAIAQALGVKKPFMYWYFDNKEDLFAELCIRSAEVSTSTLVARGEDKGCVEGSIRILQENRASSGWIDC
jgi:AcrR family transcriptional regulator